MLDQNVQKLLIERLLLVENKKNLIKLYPQHADDINTLPNKYLMWLSSRFVSKKVQEVHPIEDCFETLQKYSKVENSVNAKFRDKQFVNVVNRMLPDKEWNDPRDIMKLTIDEMEMLIVLRERKKPPFDIEAVEIQNDEIVGNIDGWNIYVPLSRESSCVIAQYDEMTMMPKTTWCTARIHGSNLFYNYVGREEADIILYYVIKDDAKDVEDFLSIGLYNGKVRLNGQNGGLSVDRDNIGLTVERVKKIFGASTWSKVEAKILEDAKRWKDKDGNLVHPAKQKVKLARTDRKELQNFIRGLSASETEDAINMVLDGDCTNEIRLDIFNNKKYFNAVTKNPPTQRNTISTPVDKSHNTFVNMYSDIARKVLRKQRNYGVNLPTDKQAEEDAFVSIVTSQFIFNLIDNIIKSRDDAVFDLYKMSDIFNSKNGDVGSDSVAYGKLNRAVHNLYAAEYLENIKRAHILAAVDDALEGGDKLEEINKPINFAAAIKDQTSLNKHVGGNQKPLNQTMVNTTFAKVYGLDRMLTFGKNYDERRDDEIKWFSYKADESIFSPKGRGTTSLAPNIRKADLDLINQYKKINNSKILPTPEGSMPATLLQMNFSDNFNWSNDTRSKKKKVLFLHGKLLIHVPILNTSVYFDDLIYHLLNDDPAAHGSRGTRFLHAVKENNLYNEYIKKINELISNINSRIFSLIRNPNVEVVSIPVSAMPLIANNPISGNSKSWQINSERNHYAPPINLNSPRLEVARGKDIKESFLTSENVHEAFQKSLGYNPVSADYTDSSNIGNIDLQIVSLDLDRKVKIFDKFFEKFASKNVTNDKPIHEMQGNYYNTASEKISTFKKEVAAGFKTSYSFEIGQINHIGRHDRANDTYSEGDFLARVNRSYSENYLSSVFISRNNFTSPFTRGENQEVGYHEGGWPLELDLNKRYEILEKLISHMKYLNEMCDLLGFKISHNFPCISRAYNQRFLRTSNLRFLKHKDGSDAFDSLYEKPLSYLSIKKYEEKKQTETAQVVMVQCYVKNGRIDTDKFEKDYKAIDNGENTQDWAQEDAVDFLNMLHYNVIEILSHFNIPLQIHVTNIIKSCLADIFGEGEYITNPNDFFNMVEKSRNFYSKLKNEKSKQFYKKCIEHHFLGMIGELHFMYGREAMNQTRVGKVNNIYKNYSVSDIDKLVTFYIKYIKENPDVEAYFDVHTRARHETYTNDMILALFDNATSLSEINQSMEVFDKYLDFLLEAKDHAEFPKSLGFVLTHKMYESGEDRNEAAGLNQNSHRLKYAAEAGSFMKESKEKFEILFSLLLHAKNLPDGLKKTCFINTAIFAASTIGYKDIHVENHNISEIAIKQLLELVSKNNFIKDIQSVTFHKLSTLLTQILPAAYVIHAYNAWKELYKTINNKVYHSGGLKIIKSDTLQDIASHIVRGKIHKHVQDIGEEYPPLEMSAADEQEFYTKVASMYNERANVTFNNSGDIIKGHMLSGLDDKFYQTLNTVLYICWHFGLNKENTDIPVVASNFKISDSHTMFFIDFVFKAVKMHRGYNMGDIGKERLYKALLSAVYPGKTTSMYDVHILDMPFEYFLLCLLKKYFDKSNTGSPGITKNITPSNGKAFLEQVKKYGFDYADNSKGVPAMSKTSSEINDTHNDQVILIKQIFDLHDGGN